MRGHEPVLSGCPSANARRRRTGVLVRASHRRPQHAGSIYSRWPHKDAVCRPEFIPPDERPSVALFDRTRTVSGTTIRFAARARMGRCPRNALSERWNGRFKWPNGTTQGPYSSRWSWFPLFAVRAKLALTIANAQRTTAASRIRLRLNNETGSAPEGRLAEDPRNGFRRMWCCCRGGIGDSPCSVPSRKR